MVKGQAQEEAIKEVFTKGPRAVRDHPFKTASLLSVLAAALLSFAEAVKHLSSENQPPNQLNQTQAQQQ